MPKDNFNKAALKKSRNLSSISDALISGITDTGSNKRKEEIVNLAKEYDNVIDNDSSMLSRNSSDEFDSFIRGAISNKNTKEKKEEKESIQAVSEIFETEADEMFNIFQKQYNVRNVLYDDLDSIVERIFDLKEALFTTRDSIVTADELNKTVSREIIFNSGQNDVNSASLKTVEEMELKYDVLNKIKNQIVPGALLYGVFYTYEVPYSHIFQEFQRRKNNTEYRTSLTESAMGEVIMESDISALTECGIGRKEANEILTEVSHNISVINEPSAVLETVNMDYISYKLDKQNEKSFTDKFKESRRGKNANEYKTQDGVREVEDFSEVRDCHFEMIDPRKIIPITIMDEVIGYYYLRADPSVQVSKSTFGEQIRKVNKGEGADKKDFKNTLLDIMVNNIVKSFDKKYLEDNIEFKEIILSALMYDDNYRKEITFQFIPADFITEHSVNDKRSMLEPSLFFGKLYLALLVYNLLTIIGRSGDQKIYWTKSSGVDKNLGNHTQAVARSIKKNRLNFNDLLSYSSIVSRVGQAKEIFAPIGKNGERGIDFDIMEGQRVDTHDELLESLKQNAINATSVPSVILNFVDQADYAKTLVMANAKHLSRCVSYQSDLNKSITEMYKSLLLFSTDMDVDLIESMEFKFSVPSGLNSMNYADLINNVDQIASYIIKVRTGENTDQTEADNATKDILYEKIARKYLPLDWELIDSMYEDARVEATSLLSKKKIESEQ